MNGLSFNCPHGVAYSVDDSTIVVADTNDHTPE